MRHRSDPSAQCAVRATTQPHPLRAGAIQSEDRALAEPFAFELRMMRFTASWPIMQSRLLR